MSTHIDEKATSPTEPGSASASYGSAPTVEEIAQLTLHELTVAQEKDSIIECGRAALSLLRVNPDLCAKLAYQKLHDVPYKQVKACWRRLYTDATLWKVLRVTERHGHGDWIDEVVKLLDMTLILTGAPLREGLIELWFTALEEELSACEPQHTVPDSSERPAKRQKTDTRNLIRTVSTTTTAITDPPLTLRRPIVRCDDLSLSAFEKKLSSPATQTPLIIENAINHWPALTERPWSDPGYLLKRTLGGRRLVPIETGRSYTDSGWGQKISTFQDFITSHMINSDATTHGPHQTGYLAQHDLFAQIPSLRADISIPDFCFCDPAPNPLPHVKEMPKLEDPLLNAWFGPKGTISPLHTDPYHNILAQVVGYKYVRLYAPDQTKWLYPRGVDENGIDMSNTSSVDLDDAMDLFPEIGLGHAEQDVQTDDRDEATQAKRAGFEMQFPHFRTAEYVEGVLGPGDCLYLPPGWWHYVTSLSSSFSVSFWFN